MLFSEEVLKRIDFYTSEPFGEGQLKYSTIVIYWKTHWWNFWTRPFIIKTYCPIVDERYQLSDEWSELNTQLTRYFSKIAPKPPVELYSIKGGRLD